jgi:hypothetical protein
MLRRAVSSTVLVLIGTTAWYVVFYPLPPLPSRFASAVFITILLAYIFWSQLRSGDAVPSEHLTELHRLADSAIDDVNADRPAQFSNDTDKVALLRREFRAHFRRESSWLKTWDKLLDEQKAATAPVADRINREAGELGQTHHLNFEHCRASLQRALDSQLVAQRPPVATLPAPLRIDPFPGVGWALVLGGSIIANAPEREPLLAAQAALEQAVKSVTGWSELAAAREARLEVVAFRMKLKSALVTITHRRVMSKAFGCPGCSA